VVTQENAVGVEKYQMAKYREYEVKDLHGRVTEQKNQSENQFPEDKKGRKYDNDVKEGWLIGSGQDATKYSNFDHRDKKTGMPKKW
jgi:hypothetical protein